MAKVIGLDVGTYAAKIVVFDKVKGNSATLSEIGMAQLPQEIILNWQENALQADAAIISALKRLNSSLKVRTKAVATSLSGDDIVIKKIQVTADNESTLKDAVLKDAEQYIPYDISKVNIAYHILEKHAEVSQFTVLLVAAKKDVIARYIDVIRTSLLKPAVIDIDALALTNAYEFVNPNNRDNIALIDIGANSITAVILKNGQPLVVKEENIGGQRLTEEFEDFFEVSVMEAESIKLGTIPAPNPGEAADITDQIVQNWFAVLDRAIELAIGEDSSYSMERIFLTGGSSLLLGLDKQFEERFNLPCSVFNPFEKIIYSKKKFDPEYINYIGPQMAISFGLALRREENL